LLNIIYSANYSSESLLVAVVDEGLDLGTVGVSPLLDCGPGWFSQIQMDFANIAIERVFETILADPVARC